MPDRVSSPVFVGRRAELARLREALEVDPTSSRRATLVGGEAGVGKTRLMNEFGRAAEADGARLLVGRCIDLGDGSLPFGPIVSALRGYVRSAPDAEVRTVIGDARDELARLIPDLGPASSSSTTISSIGSAQGRFFELLLGIVQRLAGRAGFALVIEDLHWSDHSTRDLLAFLIQNAPDRLTLVMTFRSDELHRRHPLVPFIAELDRTGLVDRIELERLDRQDLAAQLRAIGGPGLDQTLIDSIHARSDGNAFFAEELLAAARNGGPAQLPRNLRDVILARVGLLEESTQEFLRIASAAGQRVDPDLLAAATAMEQTDIYSALREAVGHQILVLETANGKERYAFRHALVREAVYDDLLPGERVRLHATFARSLETLDPDRAMEIADHWYAARDVPRALAAAMAAGRAAERSYAYPEALAQYERILELWDLVADAGAVVGHDRIDVLGWAARTAQLHEPQRAIAHLRMALGLLDAAADPVRAGLLHLVLGRSAWVAGHGELALEAYRTAIALIPTDPASEARARALAGLAQILNLTLQFDASRQAAEEAVILARRTSSRQIEGHALNTRGTDRCLSGEIEAGLADVLEALRIAKEVEDADDIMRGYANLLFAFETSGRLDEAVTVGVEGIAASERIGLVRFFGTHLLCNVADLQFRLGRWEASERAAERAAALGLVGINEILGREILGRLAIARGSLDQAEAHLDGLATLARDTGDVQFMSPVFASLAELALWQARPTDAAELASEGIARIGASPQVRIGELYVLAIRAWADVAAVERADRAGDADACVVAAEQLLLRLRDRHAEVARTRPSVAPLSAAFLGHAEAEFGRAKGASEPDTWASVAAAWEDLGQPYPAAYAGWREGQALLAARGDRARAAAALAASHVMLTRLGATLLDREVTAVAQRGRLPIEPNAPNVVAVQADSPAARFGLTPRELEVLALVALGRTNREIADALFITVKTASVHVSNILGKLGVAGRGEAAAIAHRLGLADPA